MLLSRFNSMVCDPEIKVLSLDVFDTLLLRDTKPEILRFKEISAKQAKAVNTLVGCNISPQDFFILRLEAARTAYSSKKLIQQSREASWKEIFELMLGMLDVAVDQSVLDQCKTLELEYEFNRLSPNKRLTNLISVALENGKSVVCLSDMYLASQDICILIEHVTGLRNLPVYASGDFGYGKGSGALFRKLMVDFSLRACEIFHIGDNATSDFSVPRQLGIGASYLPRHKAWRATHAIRTLKWRKRLQCL